jgi:hypothetical protein
LTVCAFATGRILCLDCSFGLDWKFFPLPGVKAADHVADVSETGSLQQAARDHAAVSALAMDCNGLVAVDPSRVSAEKTLGAVNEYFAPISDWPHLFYKRWIDRFTTAP